MGSAAASAAAANTAFLVDASSVPGHAGSCCASLNTLSNLSPSSSNCSPQDFSPSLPTANSCRNFPNLAVFAACFSIISFSILIASSSNDFLLSSGVASFANSFSCLFTSALNTLFASSSDKPNMVSWNIDGLADLTCDTIEFICIVAAGLAAIASCTTSSTLSSTSLAGPPVDISSSIESASARREEASLSGEAPAPVDDSDARPELSS